MRRRYSILVLISLTIAVLVACEPLAPDQTPWYVVVTGETPDSVSMLAATSPVEQSLIQVGAAGAGDASAAGIVNTPAPTDTPVAIATALPTASAFVCREATGQLLQMTFYSEVAGKDVPYQIYLPPCFYTTLQRYPYVILLHGIGYDNQMWVDLDAPGVVDRGVKKETLPPMVLVMPEGGWLSYMNDLPAGATFADLIIDELIPEVEREFCLWGSREGRAIGGISRGGFWSFSMAFTHPELFSVLGGHSPYFEPDNASPSTNPLDLVKTVSLDKTPLRIYFDHSVDDYVKTHVMLMEQLLSARGIEFEYVINAAGDHTMEYWSAHIADYLAFYGKDWPFDVAALPSCLEPSP